VGAPEKGNVSAEIAQDVINEALRSVERRTHGAAPDGGAELNVEVETAPAPDPVPGDAATAAEGAPPAPSAEQKELASLKAQLDFSQAKSRELMEKVKDEHERRLRAAADLDNFRKRAQKEKEEVQKFGAEKLLRDLLPVADNLDRALEHATGPGDFDSLLKGLKMTRKMFEDALGKHGVTGFSAQGQPFDPRLHEAMQQVETSDMPPNHVAVEVLRGYTLNDRLVRPALVMVSKAKAPESGQPAPKGEAGEQGS
jgi:molecular chaperone GrpE